MSDLRCGGLVLCGGNSTRMGQSKPTLPFGPEPLLARVVRCLDEVVSPLLVVAAAEQVLPPLALRVEIVRDRRPGRGPLEGLAAGFAALVGRVDRAFVTGCDAPLLRPSFVHRIVDLLGDHAAAVPVVAGRYHPLAAAYRVSVLPLVEQLLAEDRLRVMDLFSRLDTRRITEDELAEVDPTFESLRNINDPADYHAALAIAGLLPPDR